MDYNNITEEEQKALHITFVSENGLDFDAKGVNNKVEIYKYEDDDNDLEIDINGVMVYLTKGQQKFLKGWL